MTLTQEDPATWLGAEARVHVVALEGLPGLLPAALVALAVEAAGHTVTLLVREGADGPVDPARGDWAGSTAAWFGEQSRPVRLVSWGGGAIDGEVDRVVAVGGAAVLLEPPEETLRALAAIAETRLAVVGLGAEAVDGVAPERAEVELMDRAAQGELVASETVRRFGTVGRHFVELVEHVHHLAGPTGQCPRADAIRAALFGRHGEVPVSLTTRSRPPRLSPLTATIQWITLGPHR